jgi:hypothetical protein
MARFFQRTKSKVTFEITKGIFVRFFRLRFKDLMSNFNFRLGERRKELSRKVFLLHQKLWKER